MIKLRELQQIAGRNQVSDRQIEKDYIISWILYGISLNRLLSEGLAFKGGTALKKAWFPDYRFSEDLDFTLLDEAVSNEALMSEFGNACQIALEEANIPLQIRAHRVHAQSQGLNCYVDYIGPLDARPGSRDLKIDITRNERLEFETQQRKISAAYSDLEATGFSLRCYSLSEILIEKMAALMGRTVPRDLYDFWYLTEMEQLDLNDHVIEFESKARRKGHDPTQFAGKVRSKEGKYKSEWSSNLAHQIKDLPDFEEVWRRVLKQIRSTEPLK